MQIGIMIEGQDGLNWTRWQRILQTSEDAGYQCVFRSDHFTNADGPDKDSLELWVSLAYAATHTRRIEFGPLVAPVTFRHPAMTVRMAAQVDDLSGGRLALGLGAGWQEREHRKFGFPFYDFPTRFNMLTDALEITLRLLHSDGPVSYSGQHFSLDNAQLRPRPQRPGGPPIVIGGSGPTRTLPLAAKYADEWNAAFIPLSVWKERAALLDQLLPQHGRTPGEVKRSLMMQVIYGRDDAAVKARLAGRDAAALRARGIIIGTGPQVVDTLSQWQEAGLQRILLQWLDQDDTDGIEQMAQDVLPHFPQ
jgi:F420-dependent oxidoreductase-like protein